MGLFDFFKNASLKARYMTFAKEFAAAVNAGDEQGYTNAAGRFVVEFLTSLRNDPQYVEFLRPILDDRELARSFMEELTTIVLMGFKPPIDSWPARIEATNGALRDHIDHIRATPFFYPHFHGRR